MARAVATEHALSSTTCTWVFTVIVPCVHASCFCEKERKPRLTPSRDLIQRKQGHPLAYTFLRGDIFPNQSTSGGITIGTTVAISTTVKVGEIDCLRYDSSIKVNNEFRAACDSFHFLPLSDFAQDCSPCGCQRPFDRR